MFFLINLENVDNSPKVFVASNTVGIYTVF